MFEKLLSLLPYNPSLAQQLAFYARRMREEASIRRTGLVFIVLAFMVQFFAVISPPQSTTAASNNDLVNGGFSSAGEAARYCNNNTANYADILANYGITCGEVANSPTIHIRSTDYGRQLYSMGRLPYGIAGETPVNVKGQTYYFRYLWGWDTKGASNYSALRIIARSTGKTYFLLYNCGNVVSVGLPQAYAPPPQFSLTKSMLAGYPGAEATVRPGATLGYHINVNNGGGTGHQVKLIDTIPANTAFQSQSLNAGASVHTYHSDTRTAEWQWDTIGPESGAYSVDLRVTVNAAAPDGSRVCNAARLDATDSGALDSNQVCVTVQRSAPPPTTPPPTPTTTSTPTPTPTPTPPQPTCQNGGISPTADQCKPCAAAASSQDKIACVTVHKTASNLTTGAANADGTIANPGDLIHYTLYAQNTGKETVQNFTFQENLSDVMDYAVPKDLHGGSIDAGDVVSWAPVDISAGQTASQQITVAVKNPLPATPTDPGDPAHFDHLMTNVYGNTVNIKLPGSQVTPVESASTSLPNTGPGASLFIGALIVSMAGYFYGRARLLARESIIALQETTSI